MQILENKKLITKAIAIQEATSGIKLAVGSSICGATAILLQLPLLEQKKKKFSYAVANITIFGILQIYPYLAHWLFNDSYAAAGLFLGTAIHETAQVAGAGLIYGQLFETEAKYSYSHKTYSQ